MGNALGGNESLPSYCTKTVSKGRILPTEPIIHNRNSFLHNIHQFYHLIHYFQTHFYRSMRKIFRIQNCKYVESQ